MSSLRVRCTCTSAFTLLELLAVLSILGILSIALLRGSGNHDQSDLVQRIYQFDQSLREQAKRIGTIHCRVSAGELQAFGAAFEQSIKLPIGTRFKNSQGHVLQSWSYNRKGCSIDYQITWRDGSAFIAGLSGYILDEMPQVASTEP